jgi:hypothetical protein
MKVLIAAILVFTVMATLPYSLVAVLLALVVALVTKIIERDLKTSEAMELDDVEEVMDTVASDRYMNSRSINIDASRQTSLNKTSAERQEDLVSYFLNTLDKDMYTVINNVTIPSNGSTSHTQIDHIVVSRYGVFCIETKSHKGWIFGSENRKYWTQVLYEKHFQLYNPLRQNFAHVQALKLLLGVNLKRSIISIIVFTKADKIQFTGDGNVGDIMSMIEKINKTKTIVYDPDEYDRIITSIRYANRTDSYTIGKHQAEVRNLVALANA